MRIYGLLYPETLGYTHPIRATGSAMPSRTLRKPRAALPNTGPCVERNAGSQPGRAFIVLLGLLAPAHAEAPLEHRASADAVQHLAMANGVGGLIGYNCATTDTPHDRPNALTGRIDRLPHSAVALEGTGRRPSRLLLQCPPHFA